jgi:hypothetical protein
MTFMIIVFNNYNLLLGLDFFIRININVYMEKKTIQIEHGLEQHTSSIVEHGKYVATC